MPFEISCLIDFIILKGKKCYMDLSFFVDKFIFTLYVRIELFESLVVGIAPLVRRMCELATHTSLFGIRCSFLV